MRAAWELESDIGARLAALFRRCPQLCGFLVEEREVQDSSEADGRELELYVAGIDVFPALGQGQSETLVAQISVTLADLLEESPEAADLLVGRTFARMTH